MSKTFRSQIAEMMDEQAEALVGLRQEVATAALAGDDATLFEAVPNLLAHSNTYGALQIAKDLAIESVRTLRAGMRTYLQGVYYNESEEYAKIAAEVMARFEMHLQFHFGYPRTTGILPGASPTALDPDLLEEHRTALEVLGREITALQEVLNAAHKD